MNTIMGVSSSNINIAAVANASNNAVDAGGLVIWGLIMDTAISGSGFWLFEDDHPTLTPSEIDFQEQERMFNEIPPLLLEPYRGQLVASKNGRIVDSDIDLDSLVERFFTAHGEVPVYITKIGGEMREFIDTPFID